MSFGFTAVGTAAECAAQLAVVETDNVLGQRLADTLGELLGDPENEPKQHTSVAQGEYRYVIKAGGHSGRGSTTYLNATVETVWVPKVAIELGEAFEEIDEGARAAAAAHAAGDED